VRPEFVLLQARTSSGVAFRKEFEIGLVCLPDQENELDAPTMLQASRTNLRLFAITT
jgi:hypothetical protein